MQNGFDEVEYPNLENKPKRFTILERNKYMVKKAGYIIAYVNHPCSGALKTLQYAIRIKKPYTNLGSKTVYS